MKFKVEIIALKYLLLTTFCRNFIHAYVTNENWPNSIQNNIFPFSVCNILTDISLYFMFTYSAVQLHKQVRCDIISRMV